MKSYRESLMICMVVAVLQTIPLDAYAIEVVYPPGAPHIWPGFHSTVGVHGRRRTNVHQGIDIRGGNGQSILAVADGTVLEATVDKCWGPTIAVDHGNGSDGKKIIALYGHVGEMLVEAGDQIQRGQVIARLGDNQYKYRCMARVRHLHFQIGREYRSQNDKKSYHTGNRFFLKDAIRGVNPHLYWADGQGKVTCFDPNRTYISGSLTYPFPCA